MNILSYVPLFIGPRLSAIFCVFLGFLISGPLARAEDSLDTISPLTTNILTPRSSTIPSVRTAEIYIKQLNLYRERFDTEASHLSLEECVQLGLTKSPLLGAAFSAIQQAEFTVKAKIRKNYPSLTLSDLQPFLGKVYTSDYSTTRSQSESFEYNNVNDTYLPVTSSVEDSSSSEEQYYQLGPYFTLTWTFFNPTLWAQTSASQQDVDRERLSFDVSARGLLLNIQEAYLELQSNYYLVRSFEKIFSINQDQVDYVEARYKAGLSNIGELDQSKNQLFQQASELVDYYQQYFESAYKLAALLDLPQGSIVVPNTPLAKESSWALPLDETVEQALNLREEIMVYLAEADAAIWNARAAMREYLPEFSFQGFAYGYYEWDGSTKSSSSGVEPYQSTYKNGAWGLGVSWNIFDFGVYAAESQSYEASAKQKKFQADSERLKVKKQIRVAYATYQASKDLVYLSEESVRAAEAYLKSTKTRYRVGLDNMVAITQAMQSLGTAIRSRSNALVKYNLSVAKLYRYSALWPPNILPLSSVYDSTKSLKPTSN